MYWISQMSHRPVVPNFNFRGLFHTSKRRKCVSLIPFFFCIASAGCSRTGLTLPDPASLPPRVIPAEHNAYRVSCSLRIPRDRITPETQPFCPEDSPGSGFCRQSQSHTVIFPPELNVNSEERVAGAHRPTEAELEADAAGRVTNVVREGGRLIYSDCRVQAACTAVFEEPTPGIRRIETFPDGKGNMACPSIALDMTNLQRATFVSAPNRPDCALSMNTPRICRPPSFDPPTTPPDGFLSAVFGRHSRGEVVSGTATVLLRDRPEVVTRLRGDINLSGGPCPEASCDVGLAIRLRADDISYGSDSVREISIVGAGEAPGAALSPAGFGSFAAGRFFFTISATGHGTFLGGPVAESQAYLIANSDPINLSINWTTRTFAIDGVFRMVSGSTDKPTNELNVRMNLQGRLNNTPPVASVEPDKILECASSNRASFVLRGRGTDLENNIISYIWRTDRPRVDYIIGVNRDISWEQELGTQTYTLRVLDQFLQTSMASLRVTVQDTTPPTIIRPLVQVPCGWGGKCEDPKNPKLCITLAAEAKDACSNTLNVVVHSVESFLGCSNTLLGSVKQDNCIRFDPAIAGSELSNIVYRVRYSVRDESGNMTPAQSFQFKIQSGGDRSSCPDDCPEPRSVIMSPCG